MRRNRRLAIAGLTTAAVIAGFAAFALTTPGASANVDGPYFATQSNGSDPHIINCNDGVKNGYCLYTSVDMGPEFAYPPGCLTTGGCWNYYPMVQTRVYFSSTGHDNWSPRGIAFEEPTLYPYGWVPVDALHLWAPSAVRTPTGPNKAWEYWLFVPDIAEKSEDGVHASSRIAVAKSNNPFSGFQYQGVLPFSSGYMSDPDVIVKINAQNDVTERLIIWADGDWNTCGGFKWARLNSQMTGFTNTPSTLSVNGVGVLGSCATSPGRPYMEGASLYNVSYSGDPWTIFFAAKPADGPDVDGADDVPAECSSTWGGNNSTNEAIAWASASNPPTGSGTWNFTYKNVVMCGSDSEWTNQATVTKASNGRRIIIYHDGPPHPTRLRKLHAECLFAGGTRVAGVYRQPLNATYGFTTCTTSSDNSKYGALWAHDPGFGTTIPPIISSTNSGNDELAAKRYAVGPSERFKFEVVSGDIVAIKALQSGKYVCANGDTIALKPTCASATIGAQFRKVSISGTNSFYIRAVRPRDGDGGQGRLISIDFDAVGNKRLFTSSDLTSTAATFDFLLPT